MAKYRKKPVVIAWVELPEYCTVCGLNFRLMEEKYRAEQEARRLREALAQLVEEYRRYREAQEAIRTGTPTPD